MIWFGNQHIFELGWRRVYIADLRTLEKYRVHLPKSEENTGLRIEDSRLKCRLTAGISGSVDRSAAHRGKALVSSSWIPSRLSPQAMAFP